MDINKYPKSKELLRNQSREGFRVFLSSFPGGGSVEVDKYVDEWMAVLLENNLRGLYDFFDKNNIFLLINRENGLWTSTVGDAKVTAANRSKAEEEGFINCFEILEKL
jgi:hypothetical protein